MKAPSAYALFEQGHMLYQLGKYKDAEKKYAESLVIDPQYPYARWGLGLSLIEQGKTREGIKELEKGLALHPEETMFYNALAATYYNTMNYKKSLALSKEWLKKHPNSSEAHTLLARSLMEKGAGEKRKVFHHLKEALRIDPFNEEAVDCMALAHWYFDRNKAAAIKEYDVLLKGNPSDAYVHNNFGVLLLEVGEAKRALEEFKIAFQLRPTLPRVVENIGRALASTHPTIAWAYKINVFFQKILDKIPFRRKGGVINIILTYIVIRISLSVLSLVDPTIAGLILLVYIVIVVYLFFGFRIFLFAFKRGWIH